MQILLVIDVPFVFIILISLGAFFIGYFFSPVKQQPAESKKINILENPTVKLKIARPNVAENIAEEPPAAPLKIKPQEPVEQPNILDYKTVHPGQIRATQTRARGGKFVGSTERKKNTSTKDTK